MKSQRVDGIYDIDARIIGCGLAMAFEGVFTGLRFGRGVEPFDCDAAFDGGRGIAGIVGHAGDGAGHELETALTALPGVYGERSGWRLRGGDEGEGRNVVDVEGAGGHGDDELGGGCGDGKGLVGEKDSARGRVRGHGQVMDVES